MMRDAKHALLSVLLLAAVSFAANASYRPPSLLGGADRLLSGSAVGASLSPALCVAASYKDTENIYDHFWFGVNPRFSLLNESLSLKLVNDYIGHSLNDDDKRALLDDLGTSLHLHQRFTIVPLASQIPLTLNPVTQTKGCITASLEAATCGRVALDTHALELAFFGNDPTQAIEVKSADVDGWATSRLHLAWGQNLPVDWLQSKWRAGLALNIERGLYYYETLESHLRVEPLNGLVASDASYRSLHATSGSGYSFDLGLGMDTEVLGRSLRVELVLTDLLHHQSWTDAELDSMVYHVPGTLINTDFDADDFSDSIEDSTLTRDHDDFSRSYAPGLRLGVSWQRTGHWKDAVLLELESESVLPERETTLSYYTRWSPGRGRFHMGGEIAVGLGVGPSYGCDTGLLLGPMRIGRVDLGMLYLGLAGKGFTGLLNSSRGVYFGFSLGLMR